MTRTQPNGRLALGGLSVVLAVAGTAVLGFAHADDHGGDHDRARQAVKRGDIRPLSEILATIEIRLPGRVIEVELEREDGLYVYEFTVLSPDGRVWEVTVDARTAGILDIEDDD